MKTKNTMCFCIFRECVDAISKGKLIKRANKKDKEFHFQNWCQNRLKDLNIHFNPPKRNVFPDFCLIEYPEGYESKGLAYPGREKDFDANSNVPTGEHNGRQVFTYLEDILILAYKPNTQ